VTSQTPVVMVVDDDPSVRAATERLLRAAGYPVRTFPDTRTLFAHGRPDGPCCLILDVRMPGEDGLHFQQALADAGVRIPIVFITGHGDIPTRVRAMRAGAVDFLPKPFDAGQLLAAVAIALQADVRSLDDQQHLADVRDRYQALSPREREVFAAVTSGLLNKQVGAELGVTEKTVKVHRGRVMEKMKAEGLTDLVRMADLLHAGRSHAGKAVAGAADFTLAPLD
jgi:FixJ family two-component response regulator